MANTHEGSYCNKILGHMLTILQIPQKLPRNRRPTATLTDTARATPCRSRSPFRAPAAKVEESRA